MQKQGFTLIELMVVMSIIAVLSIFAYAPYNHYANISRVRFSAEKVEQAVNEAKSSVIAGYAFSGGTITPRQNVHIALVFSGSSNTIEMRGYPISTSTGSMTLTTGEIIREIPLESNVRITPGISAIIVYLSPNGEMWSGIPGDFKKNETQNISIAYKEASLGSSLRKTIKIGPTVTIE